MIIKTYSLIPQEKEMILDGISATQCEYIKKIEEYKRDYKKIPTVRTICTLLGGKSTATVFYMLQYLKKKGYNYDAI